MKAPLRTLLCLLLTLCLLPLTACQTQSGNWKQDLTAAEVNATVTGALPAGEGWTTVSEQYISASSWGENYADSMKKVTDHCISVSENADMNIDEVGIFRAASEKDARALKTFVEDYLEAKRLQLTPLLESYNPEELPKLDNASVTICGRYVLYTILSSAETATAKSSFEKALTAE